MAKHILFDMDDTLFPSTEFSTLARKNAINAMMGMGLEQDFETLSARLNAIIMQKGSNYPNHFDDLCRDLGIKDPGRFVAAAVGAYHDTKTSIAPFPRVPLTLLTLKERGHSLYVATRGSTIKQWDKLIRLKIALFFDDVFVSEALGEDKSEEFYRKIAGKLGAAPEGCLMVGDNEERDITPAKAVGMRTARIFSGKHASVPTKADMSISDISELLPALQRL
ncbi:MAG: HAD-IA family hydrolase [Candidatus Micrarchaeota archaeon]